MRSHVCNADSDMVTEHTIMRLAWMHCKVATGDVMNLPHYQTGAQALSVVM
jgi:hypothetical protein